MSRKGQRDPLADVLVEVAALRREGRTAETLETLQMVGPGPAVAKAAEWNASDLAPALAATFVRLAEAGPGRDAQCWGPVALVRALHGLAWTEPDTYLLACRTRQPEPVYGGKEDSAVTLRSLGFGRSPRCPR